MLSNMHRFLDDMPDIVAVDATNNYISDPTQLFVKRGMARGIFDGRYILIRYFALDNYHLPATLGALFLYNDVALYDLTTDPHEADNLARPDHPFFDILLLATMNRKLNDLISAEIGTDQNIVGL